jgi:threonylcarbamoyladenosine tRNA methylthiotransferase MtaB
MRKPCKVVIVDALGSSSGTRYSSRDTVGCGPRRIAGILESRGVSTEIMLAEDAINRPNLTDRFDSLMVSAMSIDKEAVQRIISMWRSTHERKPAIIGGPIASEPENLLRSGYDVVIVGEGENSILELLENGLKDGILLKRFAQTILTNGAVYKFGAGNLALAFHRDSLLHRQDRGQDALNSSDPSTTIAKDYPSYRALKFYVEVVRGCSNFRRTSIPLAGGRKCDQCHKCRDGELEERIQCHADIPPGCGFCAVPSLFGHARSREESKIVDEVRGLVKAGVRRIALSGSDFLDYQRDKLVAPSPLTNPTYPPPNSAQIDSLLSKLASIHEKLHMSENDHFYISAENIKPCLFNDEVASILAEYVPNSTIHLGCETGSEEHSNRLGRPSTPAQTLRAVKTAVHHGLRPYVFFIHGLPEQTAKTAEQTVALMKEMFIEGAEKLTIYRFKPLPLSAFANFPPAPPAIREKSSRGIEKVARKLNIESKFRLVDKTLDVIAFGLVREGKREGMIAYPLSDGPVVLVSNNGSPAGNRLKVKITEVLSDRLVKGEML